MDIEYEEDALVTDNASSEDLAEVLDVIEGQISSFHMEGNTLIFEIRTSDHKKTELKVCV